jgi:hypothetical protein
VRPVTVAMGEGGHGLTEHADSNPTRDTKLEGLELSLL